MVRFLLAFLMAFAGAATLGVLDAQEEWPRLLMLAATAPFIVVGGLVMLPELERISRRRRARR